METESFNWWNLARDPFPLLLMTEGNNALRAHSSSETGFFLRTSNEWIEFSAQRADAILEYCRNIFLLKCGLISSDNPETINDQSFCSSTLFEHCQKLWDGCSSEQIDNQLRQAKKKEFNEANPIVANMLNAAARQFDRELIVDQSFYSTISTSLIPIISS